MSGDLSNSAHSIQWIGTTTNRITTTGEDLVFPGNVAAYLRIAHHADFIFDADFTIEIGLKWSVKTTNQVPFSKYHPNTDGRSWLFNFRGDLTPKVLLFTSSLDGVATVNASGDFDPTLGQLYHVAADRSGTTVRLYVDGTVLGTATVSGALFNNSGQLLTIGLQSSTSPVNPFAGSVRYFRITKGVARFNGTHVVPTLPLPTA